VPEAEEVGVDADLQYVEMIDNIEGAQANTTDEGKLDNIEGAQANTTDEGKHRCI
jgi:hypothetical protein